MNVLKIALYHKGIRSCRELFSRLGLLFLLAMIMVQPSDLTAQVNLSGTETQVNTTTTNSQQNPNIAMDSSGNYIVVWESFNQDGSGFGVYGQRYLNGGTPNGSELIFNTTTADDQRYPDVAMDQDGNYMVAWMDEKLDGSGWGIYRRLYDNTGAPNGSIFRAHSASSGHQKFPDISMNKQGDIAIVWMEVALDGSTYQIKARRTDPNGANLSSDIVVDTVSADYQGYPVVAMADDGTFVVAWQREGLDGSGQGIAARRFNTSFTPIAATFQVNTTTAGNQQAPDISIAETGNFSIVWSSYGQDGDAEGIYGQKFLATGATSGSEFKISTTSTGAQTEPKVTLTREGDMIVAWSSYGQDGSYAGTYMQVYDRLGNPADAELLVNTRTADFQQMGAVAQSKFDAELVVTWQDGLRRPSGTHDGDNYGIYSQRFSWDGNQKPTAICQNIIVAADANCEANVVAADIDDGSSDPEGSPLIMVLEPAGPYSLGVHNVDLIVDDGNGGKDTCSATITVNDSTAPMVVTNNITVYLDAGGNASIVAGDIDNGSTDNCGIAGYSLDLMSFSCTDVGGNTVNLTVTDNAGNSDSDAATVTVVDTISPTVLTQNITVYLDAAGNALITPVDVDNGSSDACGINNSSLDISSFTCSDVGPNSVTLTVTDVNSNSRSKSATVTVVDTISPTVLTQNITVYLDAAGNASITPTDVDNGSSDACGINNSTLDISSFTCSDVGPNSVILTVTDINANSRSKSATVTVTDTISPTVVTQNITVYLDAAGNASITPADIDNGSSDACGINNSSLDVSSFTCSDVGPNSVILTVTDVNANSRSKSATVTVVDTISPTVVTQNITVYLDAAGNALFAPSDLDNGSSDACGIDTYSLNFPTVVSCNDIGVNPVILTVTDVNNNSRSKSATVTVVDTISPTVITQNITVYLDAAGNAFFAPSDLDNGSSDACGIDAYNLNFPTAVTCNDVGVNPVILTITDENGNSRSKSAVVTVVDTISPTVVTQNITVYLDAAGNASIAPADVDNGSSDACGINSSSLDVSSFTCSDVGPNSVLLTIMDGNNNSRSKSAIVTVVDTISPTVVTQNITVYLDAAGNALFAPSDLDNGSSDACGIDTYSLNFPTAVSCNDVGVNPVILTVTDVNSNSRSKSATVTVVDTISPTVVTQNITVYLDATGNAFFAVSDLDNGSSDACGIGAYNLNFPTVVSCNDVGVNPVILTITDVNNNSRSKSATVTVVDTISPVPNVVSFPNVVVNCSISLVAPTATDNCAGTIIGTTTDPTTYNAQGTYSVTWTYNDGNGNVKTQIQSVVVNDMTAPVPDVASLTTATGECSVTLTAPTATDDCEGTITGTTSDPTTYNSQGTYSVTWTYDDGNGNTSTQVQAVIVDDMTAPVPDVASLATATGECSVSLTSPTATDGCGGMITGTTSDPITYNIQGTYSVTWTYDDGNGNTSNQVQTVVVDDITAPVSNVLFSIINIECGITINSVPTATDACAGTIIGTTSDPLTLNTQGTHTITWTYDDGNGNTSIQVQTIVVDDKTAPVPDIATLPTASGECSVTLIAPTSTDNCEGLITGITSDPITYNAQGIYSVTWTYDDGNGNTSTQVQSVVVDDQTAPMPDVASLATATGECSVTLTAPTATDNCEGVITGTTSDPTVYNVQGTYSVTWTYDDGNGNTSMQVQSVVVDDITAPVPDVASLAATTDECSVTLIAPTATDGCEGAITGTTTDPTTYNAQGTYSVTWTYDDGNGNSITQIQSVVVDDMTAPVPDVASLAAATGECSVTLTAPTATDGCEGAITGTTTDPTVYNAQGTYSVTWTYDDGNGNTSTQIQSVIVDDITDPIFTICPGPQTIFTNVGVCNGTVPDLVALASANDNCGSASITQNVAIGTVFGTAHGDQITVTLTADDGNGNTETCDVILTLTDNEAPVFTGCPAPIELCGSQAATWTPPSASDNCSFSIASSHVPGDVFPVGVTIVNYTVTDAGGNQAVCNFEVIVHELPDVSITQSGVPEFCQGLTTLTAEVSNEASLLSPLSYFWSSGLGADAEALVQENGLYTVTVTDGRGCTSSEDITLNLTASDITAAYTLLAKNEVKLKNSTVSTGGVGVWEVNKKARVESNSVVSSFVKAPLIEIKSGGTVASQVIGQANVALPVFKENTSPGNNNITIQSGQTQTLTGSSYGKIEVKENATLIFDNPEVYIKELKTKADASVEFMQATELIVDRRVELNKNNLFNIGGEAVTVYTEDRFLVNEGSIVIANIYAEARIVAQKAASGNHTSLTGLFISLDKIISNQYVDWNANTNCDLTAPIAPVAKTVVQPVLSEFDWKLYPNPANGIVNIELPDFEKEFEIIIYDMTGRRVWSQEMRKGETKLKVDVSGKYFKSTIYLVHVVGQGINLSKRLEVMR